MSFGDFLQQKKDQFSADQQAAALQSANPNALILTPSIGGKQSGAANLAKVHRAEWNDYLNRYVPIENELFAKFNDKKAISESVDKAGLTMASAFDKSRQQTDADLSSYGVNLSDRQREMRDRRFEIDKSAAVAGAMNDMRIAKEDQRMAILAGGLSSVSQTNRGN